MGVDFAFIKDCSSVWMELLLRFLVTRRLLATTGFVGLVGIGVSQSKRRERMKSVGVVRVVQVAVRTTSWNR